ncbi:MAG: SRPBCC domain-containing protein [Ignavibacterium sp.]|nr:MAG: SRPBCC domain-containing protein [Ignavibacterium sp.]
MANIKHFLIIKAPPEKVYKAVTTTGGIKGWWTLDTIINEKVGGVAEFIFGERYHNKMKITELEPNKRVEWKCFQGDKEWIATTFEFDIEARDDNTILRFTHGNWKEETDFFAHCNYQWGYYLRSLVSYCEKGEGTPFKV